MPRPSYSTMYRSSRWRGCWRSARRATRVRCATRRHASTCTRASTAAFAMPWQQSLQSIRIGDPISADTQMGPLVNRKRLAAIEGFIADAREPRARGSRPEALASATAVSRTSSPLLDDVPDTARVMSEEPFGPVAALQPFKSLDDVIERSNRLSLWAWRPMPSPASRKTLDALADNLDVGLLGLNHCNLAAAETPFGGVKESGYGSEGGSEGHRAIPGDQVCHRGAAVVIGHSRLVSIEQAGGDAVLHDLRRAAADLEGAHVAQHALEWKLGRVAVATMDLHGGVDHLEGRFAARRPWRSRRCALRRHGVRPADAPHDRRAGAWLRP